MLPRRWRRRAEQWARDARFVWSSLTREPPPHLHERLRPWPSAPTGRGGGLVEARVVGRHRETADALTLELEPTEPAGVAMDWLPGQFLTLEVALDGRLHRRCYSLCIPPGEGRPWTVTAKRLPGGAVSPWLNDGLREGDALRVGPPAGRFVVEPDPARARRLVAIAGGSGITPIRGILEAVLAREPRSRVALVDGNRRLDDVIFRRRLDELAADDRMILRHVLEEPPEGWGGATGRLDPEILGAELDAVEAAWDGEGEAPEFYLCGPAGMMDAARETLAARGVPDARIHEERFTRGGGAATADGRDHEAIFVVAGQDVPVTVDAGRTLLEAGEAAGLPMPSSCTMGGCGACRVHLRDGEVVMEEPNCLTADERAANDVLACVARPCGDVVVEVAF